MLYPLKFTPVYKDYIWGGRNLEKIGKALPETNIAESWEISSHPDGVSIIANGPLAGMSLPEAVDQFGRDLIGTALPKMFLHRFPLLVKFIDANADLSIQIHPDDHYGYKHESGSWGKSEMFYIISAEPGARLICGVNPQLTLEEITDCFHREDYASCLNYLEVSKGDVVNVPPGVVHAIGKGMLIAEIEQNSNITYRIHDYDRTDTIGNKRPLHIDKALAVFDLEKNRQAGISKGFEEKIGDSTVRYLVENKYFSVDEYRIQGQKLENTNGKSFHIYLFIEGDGELQYGGETLSICRGESVLIPAGLGEYTISGHFCALKSYVPDIKQNIIFYLKNAGYMEEEIYDTFDR